MGLARELSYTVPHANRFHRAMQSVAASKPGAWVFSKTLARTDRLLGKVSHGRATVPAAVARLPVLVLTSTGRKSGQPRQTHLTPVPFGDELALLGTNFGQPDTPCWVLNLQVQPRATVTYRGVSRDVTARPATEPERAQILAASAIVYPGYLKYEQRITRRRLRIFVLTVV